MRNTNEAKNMRNKIFNAKYSLHKNAEVVKEVFGLEVPKDILNMKNELFYEYIMETVYPRIIETLEVPAEILRSNEKFNKFYNETILPTQGAEIAGVVFCVRTCVKTYLQYYKVPAIDFTKIDEAIRPITDKFNTPEK